MKFLLLILLKKLVCHEILITETRNSWIILLTVIKEYAPQYKLLLKAGYSTKLLEEFQKAMNEQVNYQNSELYYSNCYWTSAIIGVINQWIINDMNISIEELSDIGSKLMTEGIKNINTFGNQCI